MTIKSILKKTDKILAQMVQEKFIRFDSQLDTYKSKNKHGTRNWRSKYYQQ